MQTVDKLLSNRDQFMGHGSFIILFHQLLTYIDVIMLITHTYSIKYLYDMCIHTVYIYTVCMYTENIYWYWLVASSQCHSTSSAWPFDVNSFRSSAASRPLTRTVSVQPDHSTQRSRFFSPKRKLAIKNIRMLREREMAGLTISDEFPVRVIHSYSQDTFWGLGRGWWFL